MTFDGLGSGDILNVTPTNVDLHQIASALPHPRTSEYDFPNSYLYAGLQGALDCSYAGSNSTGTAITGISFGSPIQGISVVQASSSLPSVFDPVDEILHFDLPVAPGAPLDYSFSVNTLEPYSETDPDGATTVQMTLLPVRDIPTLSEWGLIIFSLLGLTFGAIFIRRRHAVLAAVGAGSGQFTERAGAALFVLPLYIKVLAAMLTVAVVGFVLVTWGLGPVSAVDVGGTLTCAVIVAYLVHLWILSSRESKTKPE
jgi:hypothetical protein